MEDKVIEKVGDTKAKANLQPPFYIRGIDSWCPKDYCPLVKKDKKDANWEHCNKTFSKNKEKTKFHNPSSPN